MFRLLINPSHARAGLSHCYERELPMAGIVDRAYQHGLRIVLWLSAGLVVVSLAFVPLFVKPGGAAPSTAKGRDGGSPRR